MNTIFANDVDIAQLCLDLKRNGCCVFNLSPNAIKIRNEMLAKYDTILSQETIPVLNPARLTSIQIETDNCANDDTELTSFYLKSFKEILNKINVFNVARDRVFIDNKEQNGLVNITRYHNKGEIAVRTGCNDDCLFTFNLGSTSSMLEINQNGKWINPKNNQGIIITGSLAKSCNIPSGSYRTAHIIDVPRTTIWSSISYPSQILNGLTKGKNA